MGRILIFVLIALGAGLYFQKSRAVILDVTEPGLTPVRKWTTRQEMQQIAEDLELAQGSGGSFPDGRGEFEPWLLRRNPEVERRTDAWGGAYTLRLTRDSFELVSSGPDGIPGTPDDLIESRRLAATSRGR